MMHGFRRFSTTSIHAFDLVPDMPIIVFLGQLSGRTVGGPPDLGAQFEFLLGRPAMADSGNFNVELAELSIYNQILKFSIFTHLA